MNNCETYKDCVGCPYEFKDFCSGVNKLIRDYKKEQRRNKHERRTNTTLTQIQKYVETTTEPQLTSTEILNKITSKNKRIKTNIFYINETMQSLFKFKKINGKLYYFAKFKNEKIDLY
jgi:hypothetical protein